MENRVYRPHRINSRYDTIPGYVDTFWLHHHGG